MRKTLEERINDMRINGDASIIEHMQTIYKIIKTEKNDEKEEEPKQTIL